MSVLKDASAVAIYGSRGSNGVILIQTKRGSQGEFHVTYKTKLAIAEPMQRIETMGPNEFIRLKQDMGRLKNNYSGEQLDPLVGSIISASEKVNYAKGITNDWQDYVFRTVFTMDHQLSFQGATRRPPIWPRFPTWTTPAWFTIRITSARTSMPASTRK